MPLVRLNDLSLSLGAARVLDGLSFAIEPGERVGLVGANGCGKTSLLRVMAGRVEPESGQVERARRLRIGFMEQEPELDPADNVHDAAMGAFADLFDMERRMRSIEHEIAAAEGDRRKALLKQLDRLQARFEHARGYECESRTQAALLGLGFSMDAFTQPVSVLSGGEKSRVALARLLLRESDLLLLDEPTNHLDIGGIEWLEGFLATQSDRAILIVSHDRMFLDRTVTRIVELEHGRLSGHKGNYAKHVELTALENLRRQREYDAQQEHIRKEEEFIRHHHASQRSREARGRQKRLNRIERIDAPTGAKGIHMRFEAARESGEICLRVEELSKSFEDRVLFEGLGFDVYKGDRLGIVGPNGSGKTTLLKMLMGSEPSVGGIAEVGHNVAFGYLKQQEAGPGSERTVLDEVWERKRTLDEVEVRSLLGRFLFSGDDAVLKRMRDLSGGERARVALACLMVDRPNVLVMDEPTNHLDIRSRSALESALEGYEGTIIAVSHDRYFLNRIVDKLIVLDGCSARVVHGNYEYYETLKSQESEARAAAEAQRENPKPKRRREKSRPKISKNRLARIESEISRLDQEKEALEAELARPELYADPQKAREVPERYRAVCEELEVLYGEWMGQESEADS